MASTLDSLSLMDPTSARYWNQAYTSLQQDFPDASDDRLKNILSLAESNYVKKYFFHMSFISIERVDHVAEARKHYNPLAAEPYLHLLTTGRSKRSTCIECGTSLRDSHACKKHIDLQHAPEYECLQCRWKFESHAAAKEHRNRGASCRKAKLQRNYPNEIYRCHHTGAIFSSWERKVALWVELSLDSNCVKTVHHFHSLLRLPAIKSLIERLPEAKCQSGKAWIDRTWSEDQMIDAIRSIYPAGRRNEGRICSVLQKLYPTGKPKRAKDRTSNAQESQQSSSPIIQDHSPVPSLLQIATPLQSTTQLSSGKRFKHVLPRKTFNGFDSTNDGLDDAHKRSKTLPANFDQSHGLKNDQTAFVSGLAEGYYLPMQQSHASSSIQDLEAQPTSDFLPTLSSSQVSAMNVGSQASNWCQMPTNNAPMNLANANSSGDAATSLYFTEDRALTPLVEEPMEYPALGTINTGVSNNTHQFLPQLYLNPGFGDSSGSSSAFNNLYQLGGTANPYGFGYTNSNNSFQQQ